MELFCQTENAQLMVKCNNFFASYLTDVIAIECLAATRAKRRIDVPTNQSVINCQSSVQVEHVVMIHNSKKSQSHQSEKFMGPICFMGSTSFCQSFYLTSMQHRVSLSKSTWYGGYFFLTSVFYFYGNWVTLKFCTSSTAHQIIVCHRNYSMGNSVPLLKRSKPVVTPSRTGCFHFVFTPFASACLSAFLLRPKLC